MVKIIIEVRGGVIQNIITTDPDTVIHVMDYDDYEQLENEEELQNELECFTDPSYIGEVIPEDEFAQRKEQIVTELVEEYRDNHFFAK